MGKRIFWICVILLIGVGVWYGYKNYKTEKTDTDGAVVCVQNCDTPEQKARFARENSGDTPDGDSEHKLQTAREDASAIAAGFPAGPAPAANSTATQPGQGYGNNQVVPNVVPEGQKTVPENMYGLSNNALPANQTTANATQTMGQPVANQPSANQMSMNSTPAMAPVGFPLSDTRSPNAPNDLRLGGSGSYQWYRQGNLTWRVDTNTGRSCIIYATMEEWQKRIVASHGCGRSA